MTFSAVNLALSALATAAGNRCVGVGGGPGRLLLVEAETWETRAEDGSPERFVLIKSVVVLLGVSNTPKCRRRPSKPPITPYPRRCFLRDSSPWTGSVLFLDLSGSNKTSHSVFV